MSTVRVVSFNSLRRRLATVLGDESPLFQRFDEALGASDEALITALIDSLDSHPAAVKKEVEGALLAWLFDAEDATGLLDLPPASEARH